MSKVTPFLMFNDQMGYNGVPHFTFSDGFALFVDCRDQAEVDEYWDKIAAGASRCSAAGSPIPSAFPGRSSRGASWNSSRTRTH